VRASPGAQSLRTPYDAQLIPSHKLGAAHFLLEILVSFIRLGVLTFDQRHQRPRQSSRCTLQL
jgi:hypothetical protein